MNDSYGVPTGVVPRTHTPGAYPPGVPTWTCLSEGCGRVHYSIEAYDACKASHVTTEQIIQQAVDDYLLMERKARAWDQLKALCAVSTDPVAPLVIDLMQGLEQTAQTDAPAITR